MNARALCFLLAASLPVVGSCSDDKDESPDPATPFPYAAPAVATMELNVADLDQGAALASTGLCHALSGLLVTWINANVVVRLAIPAATLDACVHQSPVYLGGDRWRWTATRGVGGSAWTAELTGLVRSEHHVDWEMRVTGTVLHLDRFLWFDGSSDAAARSGVWHYFDPGSSQAQTELVTCSWSLPLPGSEDRELQFENVESGSDGLGDILRYELADSIAEVAFLDSSVPATSRVHWDLRDGVGMAVSAAGDTCCWGSRSASYPDVECP